MTKLDTLIDLLRRASVEAERLGPAGHIIVERLEEVLREAQGLAAAGDRPDEGKRPEELSSANDG